MRQRILVSILCQSRLFLLQPAAIQRASRNDGIHPLSIEAISPTIPARVSRTAGGMVSILCQSRLFLLPNTAPHRGMRWSVYPSSVNRGYFSYGGSDGHG